MSLVILSLWRSIHKFKAYLKFFGFFANAQNDKVKAFCHTEPLAKYL